MQRLSSLLLLLALVALPATAQLSGTFYIGAAGTAPGGANPGYTSLFDAVDALNTQGISGNVTMFITSDLTETRDSRLGVNTNGFVLNFRPLEGTRPVITFTNTEGTEDARAHFVIGTRTGTIASLTPSDNVWIDGSAAPRGTSRDLTFRGAEGTNIKPVIRVVGNSHNFRLLNSNVEMRSSGNTGAVAINNAGNAGPNNARVINNTISNPFVDGIAFGRIGAAAVETSPTAFNIVNNDITAMRRAINVLWRSFGSIEGNTIRMLPNNPSAVGTTAIYCGFAPVGGQGTIDITRNQFVQIPGVQANAFGIDNQIVEPVIVNVTNNYFGGFETVENASNLRVAAVRHFGPNSTTNVYHNTIVIPELVNITTPGSSFIAGIAHVDNGGGSPNGNMDVLNNIIVVRENGMKAFGIYFAGFNGTVSSDFNAFDITGSEAKVAFFGSNEATSLGAWYDLSGYDENSVAKTVVFESDSSPRLAGASLGDSDLTGLPLELITIDLFGNPRSSTAPYMGAHEPGVPLSADDRASVQAGLSLSAPYPNPASGDVRFTLTATTPQDVQVRMYDVLGREVAQVFAGWAPVGVPMNLSVDTRGLASGVYFIRAEGVQGQISRSILVR